MILLDTSVLSMAFRRRHPGNQERRVQVAVEAFMAGDAAIGLPGIVLQEVLSGIRSEKQFVELRDHLVSAFAIVHPTTSDHVEAARLKNKCLAKGLNVSGIDCLIAAVAVAGDHELFAVDGDFVSIAKHAPLRLLAGNPV